MRLVTCSSDNLMFWEVNSNQLRSCPLSQSEVKYDGFTDIFFALPSALTGVLRLYMFFELVFLY